MCTVDRAPSTIVAKIHGGTILHPTIDALDHIQKVA
jgi:hypothetical protein